MQNTAFIVLVVVVIAIGAGILLRSNKANASEQDQVVQKMLIDLTVNMKSYSERSEVDFKYWADLNDALLSHITSYYNENLPARFESTKGIIIEAESRVKEISSTAVKSKQQEMLVEYTSEIETNKQRQHRPAGWTR